MKLVYPNIQMSTELCNDRINSVVIERPALFEQFVMDLMIVSEKKSDEIMLYHEEERCDIAKHTDIIFTPFDLTYEKREIQKKLFLLLQEVSETQDIISAFAEANGRLLELLSQLNYESEYDIEYEADFNLQTVLKNYSVRICSPEGNFAEKAISYMTNLKKLINKDVFIFVNCDAYISECEYFHLEKCAQHYELYIIFVENRQISLQCSINEYIIDVDLCEIH